MGTAATLAIVLEDLKDLQAALGPNPAPPGRGFSSLARALEPRQREALAMALDQEIARLQVAQSAAAEPGAGDAARTAAEDAARRALSVLQLVVAADTAARAGAGEAVRTAAADAIRRIGAATGDAAEPAEITRVLDAALDAANARVRELEAELAAAGGSDADLLRQLTDARADLATAQAALTAANAEVDRLAAAQGETHEGLTAAQADLNAELVQFGDNSVPRRSTAVVRLEPRMTGLTVMPAADYDPYGGYQATGWTADATTTSPSSSAKYRDKSDTFVEGSGRIKLDPDPVLYSASDKSVISTDPHTGHFPARGLAVRSVAIGLRDLPNDIGRDTRTEINRLLIQGRRKKVSGYGNWHAEAFTTFRYDTANGITMGFGGDGVIYSDLEQYSAIGGFQDFISDEDHPLSGGANEPLDDAVTGDIEISFGAPSGRDPVGEPGEPGTYYWRVQGRDPRILKDAQRADRVISAKRAQAYADYELVLSNYAGRKNATSSRRYLRHAAYGLFLFTDHIFEAGKHFYGRMQVFHYGKNAFGAGTGRSVSDVGSGANDKIMAKFEGRTHGFMLRPRNHNAPAKTDNVVLGERIRIRGDVKLTANIGGATPTNTVTGKIENLEHAIGTTGRWTDSAEYYLYHRTWDHDGDGADADDDGPPRTTAPVELNSIMQGTIALNATIDTTTDGGDGSFTGTATPDDFTEGVVGTSAVPKKVWAAGEFEGSLYGPLDNLEAAGTWWVPAATDNRGVEALIGSFGAVSVCTESSNGGGAGACAAP